MALEELRFGIESDGQTEFVLVQDAGCNDLGFICKENLEPYFANTTAEFVAHTTYTPAEVAALVEEIKARTYDGVKARVLSLLEALLQAKGMGDSPAGRVLDILLKDVDRLILDTATKHVPEITPALLDERRRDREGTEADASLQTLRDREQRLEGELELIRSQVSRREQEGAIRDLNIAAGRHHGTGRIEEAIKVLERREPSTTITAALNRGAELGRTSG